MIAIGNKLSVNIRVIHGLAARVDDRGIREQLDDLLLIPWLTQWL